jgi:glycosyltransferase involved in cell wall biosynthesis
MVDASPLPVVSIGLPVYNGEATLRRALDALLAQDFTDFELIISDNASTDGTRAICEEYAARDERIRYHRNEKNLGAAANYNRVAELARGEFFRWAAHDDLCDPSHLKRCMQAMRDAPPGTVLCYPCTLIIDGEEQVTEKYEDGIGCVDSRPHVRLGVVLRELVLCNSVMGLMRLEALRKTRLIARFRSSDVLLLSELAMLGPVVEIPEYLFLRRRDAKSYGVARLTPEEQAVWFDTASKGVSSFVRTTLFLQHLVSISRLPLGLGERFRCTWTLFRCWVPRSGRVMGGELKRVLKRGWSRGRSRQTRGLENAR